MKRLVATYVLTLGLLFLLLAVYYRDLSNIKEMVKSFTPILP
jgi:hypothetical protein